jgi:carboxypeptidase C (cathepsin A)
MSTSTARRRLPDDVTTRHFLELPNRTLRFAATAGSIQLSDAQGSAQAEIAFVAYRLEGTAAPARAVTFVLNGGPGAASAWLQLGALGPWRIAMSGDAALPSAAPALIPNAETWLDFTDLVFIDPAGTGYSRFVDPKDEVRRQLWSVDGDIASLAVVMRRWLDENGRALSPKFLVGESYGGFRAPRLARTLQSEQGVGFRGLVLISPALDFSNRSRVLDPLSWAIRLPTMVAAAHGVRGDVDRAILEEAERYAVGDYLVDLLRGEQDAAAVARITSRIIALTGLDAAFVTRRHGRIGADEFLRELGGAGRVGSAYDATTSGIDPFPSAPSGQHADPVLDALVAPLTSAMLDLYSRLNWRPEAGQAYAVLNRMAAREWNWGRAEARPEAVSSLRTALALDPHLQVIIAHGMFDLVTPYLGTKLMLNQIPPRSGGDRIHYVTYPGGHMFYANTGPRAALRAEAQAVMAGR